MGGNDKARTIYIRHKYDQSMALDSLLADLVSAGVETAAPFLSIQPAPGAAD